MLKLYAKLSRELDVSRSSIESFSASAPLKYKVYEIPKRTSGTRLIAHPSRPLKRYQRALVKILSSEFKSHPSAYAYKKKLSIKDNALQHSKNKYLLKMDFTDYFNSIKPEMLLNAAEKKGLHFSDAEKALIENLCFWNKTRAYVPKLVLSVGAPTSPLLSNFVMYEFDECITRFCSENTITYTRYADDITFSTNVRNQLFSVPEIVDKTLDDIFGGQLIVNNKKTVFSSKAHNRHVTGVTIANTGLISIGRSRKRMISSLIHKFVIGTLDCNDTQYLHGLLSFASHIEPVFISRMKNKYGAEVISKIIAGRFL